MPLVDIPLTAPYSDNVGGPLTSGSSVLHNFIIRKNPDGNVLRMRNGMAALSTTSGSDNTFRGMYYWSTLGGAGLANLVWLVGNSLYMANVLRSSTIASGATSTRAYFDELVVGTTSTLIMQVNNSLYTISTAGAVTLVVDADLPTTLTPGLAVLDGYVFVADRNGRIYNSDLNNPLSWNALGFVSANQEADPNVYLTRQGNYIVLLGTYSTQFFYDAGLPAPGSPLAPSQEVTLQVGCVNFATVQTFGNKLIWAAQSKGVGEIRLVKLEGTTISILGNSSVADFVTKFMTTGVIATSYMLVNYTCPIYVLSSGATVYSFYYNFQSDTWGTFGSDSESGVATKGYTFDANDGSLTFDSPTGSGTGFIKVSGLSPAAWNGVFAGASLNLSSVPFKYYPNTPQSVAPTGTATVTTYNPVPYIVQATAWNGGNGTTYLGIRTQPTITTIVAETIDSLPATSDITNGVESPIGAVFRTTTTQLGTPNRKTLGRCIIELDSPIVQVSPQTGGYVYVNEGARSDLGKIKAPRPFFIGGGEFQKFEVRRLGSYRSLVFEYSQITDGATALFKSVKSIKLEVEEGES